MAIKPYLTAGVAFASAGAIVAATPALLTPTTEVQVAAPVAAPKSMTIQELQLLAIEDITIEGIIAAFLTGYPGDPDIDDEVTPQGFDGVAYYLVDEVFPDIDLRPDDGEDRPVDNVFFEEGFTGVANEGFGRVAEEIDALDPTGRLTLTRRVDDFFEGGVTLLVQNLINDNLPDDALGEWAKGLNDAFFEEGVVGAVTYVISTPIPTVEEPEDEDAGGDGPVLESESFRLQEDDPADARLALGGPAITVSTPKLPEPNTLETELESGTEAVETVEKKEDAKPLAKIAEGIEERQAQREARRQVIRDSWNASPIGSVLPATGKGGGAFAGGDTNFQKTVKKLKDAFGKADEDGGDDGGTDGGDAGDGAE